MSKASDFVINNGVLEKYVGPGGDVVIPEGVTAIGDWVFSSCQNLFSVTFPESVTVIGACAFDSCPNLFCVKIPDSVVHIETGAFRQCSSLANLTIPEKLKDIGFYAFSRCEKLADSDGFIIVNNILFTYIGTSENVVIPGNVVRIDSAFDGRDIKSVHIPKSVCELGVHAFAHCENLTNISIPEGVTSIGSRAFYQCINLESVTLPSSVTFIGEDAFLNCPKLEQTDQRISKHWRIDSSCPLPLNQPNQKANQGNKSGKTNEFRIKNGVLKKYFGSGGDVVIPKGITNIGDCAFHSCSDLISVQIPEGVTHIGNMAFENCANLESVIIPEGVTHIGYEAFASCDKLVSIHIPNTVTEIWWGAFHHCISLTSISIPEGISKISWRLFERCYRLKNVTILNKETAFDDTAFDRCTDLADPDGLIIVNGILFDYCGKGGEVTIPATVAKIAGYAFYDRKSLKRVTIPESVKEIGEDAFKNCGYLQVVLPDSIKKAKSAFSGCSCQVRVKRWSAAITRLMADAYLDAVIAEDYSAFPPVELLSRALTLSKEESWNPCAENESAMLAALKKNAGKLYEEATKDTEKLQFLCAYDLITPKDFDAFLAEAEKSRDFEKKMLLLDYQNKIGIESVAKARAKREKIKEDYADALIERISTRDPSKGIEGMTFVFTGAFSYRPKVWENRAELKAYLESYGAHLGTSITKKTDYLVTNEKNSKSEKSKKAKEYGALVIDEEEFNEIIGKRFRDNPEVTVPAWLREVPREAFQGCDCLKSVTISENVKSIGDRAFAWCESLVYVKMPESVTTIGIEAFLDCSGLTNVVIPESVTNIGNEAFEDCPNLTIHAPADSYAEQYAKENNIPFVAE